MLSKKFISNVLVVAMASTTFLSTTAFAEEKPPRPAGVRAIVGDIYIPFSTGSIFDVLSQAPSRGLEGDDLHVFYIERAGAQFNYYDITKKYALDKNVNLVNEDKWENVKYVYNPDTRTIEDYDGIDKSNVTTIKVIPGYEAIVTEIGTDSITVIQGATKATVLSSITSTNDAKQTYSFSTTDDVLKEGDKLTVTAENGIDKTTYTIKIAEGSGGGSVSLEQIEALRNSLQQLITTADNMVKEAPDSQKKTELNTSIGEVKAFLDTNPTNISDILKNLDKLSNAINKFITGQDIAQINSVTIDPTKATVRQGGSQDFEATVDYTGNIDKTVSWSVYEGTTELKNAITVNSDTTKATLTVPVTADITKSLTVKVTSNGNNEKSATAEVKVISKDAVATITEVKVTPDTAEVEKGGNKVFTANVSGNIEGGELTDEDKKVTWTVEGANNTGTTIDTTGKLTVAADETAASLTVKATSKVDTTKSGTASVTVKEASQADKTALTTAITAAEAAKVNVEVADDASTVAKGVYFVNQATMTTFNAAIDAAKAVKDNKTATQEQVNKATTDLTTATTTFNTAKKEGTKENGITEKGTYTGNLISVTSNNTTVTDAVYKTVYSEVYVGDTTTLKFNVKKDGVFSTSLNNNQDVKVTRIGDKSVANHATKGSETTIENVTFIEYTYTLQTGEIFDTTKNIEIELKDKTDNNKTYIVTFGTFQKK